MKHLKVLEIPDTHHPIHDKRAWKLLLTAMKWWKPDVIKLVGDFGEFESVTAHRKNPKNAARFLEKDVESVNKALDELDSLKARKKIYVFGNHESRVDRYIADKAPELYESEFLAKRLRLKERGWSYVPYGEHFRLGKVYTTHDVNAAGKNAVDQALHAYQSNIVTGHTHRIRYIVEGNATGDVHVSASFGWLGDVKKIGYKQRMKAMKDYVLGFGIGRYNPSNGFTYLTPVPIVRYSCCVEGKVFKV